MSDTEEFEKIFGKARWNQSEPFEVHAFVAEADRTEAGVLLKLELLSGDNEHVSPAILSASTETVLELFGSDETRAIEGQWRTFQLTRGSSGGANLSILTSLSDPEGVMYSILAVNSSPNYVVSAHSSPTGVLASDADIRLFLECVPTLSGNKIAILDVGQGSAAFIYRNCAGDCVAPLLYLDIGAGVWHNAKTCPAGGVKWCFTQDPNILLSHWHWDHWAGATYGGAANVKGPLEATWLVPSAAPGPLAKKLAARIIAAGGKVMHWPPNTSFIQHGIFTLGQANGSGWNDTGLVLLAELEEGRLSLLPGDAAYVYLPQPMQGKALKTLVVSHHGGFLDAVPPSCLPIPDGMVDCHAYCSVGDQNTHGHPTLIAHYQAAGWNVVGTNMRPLGQPAVHYDAQSGGQLGGVIMPCCKGAICSLELTT